MTDARAVAVGTAPPGGPAPARPPLTVGTWLVALAAGLLIGVGAAALAFVIEAPGTSLGAACVLVALVPLAIAAGVWWSCRRHHRAFGLLMVVSIAAGGLLAVWWAWAFALPAAMAWDAHATPDARAALAGIPPEKSVCVEFDHGSIGPLDAPYTRCAVTGRPESMVTYTADQPNGQPLSPYRGLSFVEGPAPRNLDISVRHLTGGWYAFTGDPSGMLGYTFTGGA